MNNHQSLKGDSPEKIIQELRADGEPESFVKWVADYMAGRVGRDPSPFCTHNSWKAEK